MTHFPKAKSHPQGGSGNQRAAVAAEPESKPSDSGQVIQHRYPVCDYVFRKPDASEYFRRRRWRLEPPLPGRTKDITYLWVRTKYNIIHKKREHADDLIYNLPEVLDAKATGETVWWTEGEKDADSLTRLGVVATSHHGGAGKINATQASWFRGHTGLVALLYDVDADDERGGNPGAADVIRRYDLLLKAGVPRDQIAVGHALVGKDVTDHIEAGHQLDELVWLDDLTALQEKAALTTRGTFRGAGYGFPANWGDKLRAAQEAQS